MGPGVSADQLSCFDIFARHILFDEIAYALSSSDPASCAVLSNVLFDVLPVMHMVLQHWDYRLLSRTVIHGLRASYCRAP
jgi:hypothetical protein